MFKQAIVKVLSSFFLTRWLLEKKRRWQKEVKYKRFDTCSPEAVPILEQALRDTVNLDGDYYEFGLYKGFLFFKAQQIVKKIGIHKDMHFFGFDSFLGLPEVRNLDAGSQFKKGMYSYDYERVRTALDKRDVDWSNTYLIKGYYAETLSDEFLLKKYPFRKAKVILIDCDLYESTKDVLNFIRKYLQDGTVVIMDDWNCFDGDDSRGERLALREFLNDNPHFKFTHLGNYSWHGAYFLVSVTGSEYSNK